jgi:hypothetical protein
MESYDVDERLRRMEHRYEVTTRSLTNYRHEFELLSRVPVQSPARLAQLAQEIERLGRERRRISEQIGLLEEQIA